jgi:RHS repeat-associated protein
VGPDFALSTTFTFVDGVVNGQGYYVVVDAWNDGGDWPVTTPTVATAAAPWSQNDTLGTANPSEPRVTCRSSWGVNCETGNFSWSHSDLAVAGRGLPLRLTWTYNTEDPNGTEGLNPDGTPDGVAPRDSGGWINNYNMWVASGPNERVVTQENGSTVYFFADGHGGWHAEGGAQATLTNGPGSGYTFYRTHELTSYVFDSSGRLVSESDRNGYTTTLAYVASGPAAGRLASVTDPEGRSLAFTYGYDTDGNYVLRSVTDPLGRTESYGYDNFMCPPPTGGSAFSCPRMTSLQDPDGGRTTFAYAIDPSNPGAAEHIVQFTSPDANALGSGNVLVNQYDGPGLYGQTGGSGRAMSYAYSTSLSSTVGAPSTEQTTITDPNGNVTVANHTNFRLTSVTAGQGSPQQTTTGYAYDPVAMGVTQITDPRGHVWKRTYDASGNVLTSADPVHPASVFTYNAQNQLMTATDPLHVTTTYSYDANNNLKTVSTPLTGTNSVQVTRYGYDPNRPGDVTTVTDPDQKIWTYSYDGNGDLASKTDPLGNETTYAYNVVGELTSSVSPKGNVPGADPSKFRTTYVPDGMGDVTSVTDPLGHETTYTYDPDQNRTSITDPGQHKTTFVYDQFDELTTVDQPDGSTLQTGYDLDGNVRTQTDAAGAVTTYGYDALGRVSSLTDPLTRKTIYGYDASGNLATLTDAAQRVTTYGYDDANELTSVLFSDGVTAPVSYGYDDDGQRTSMTDGTGQSSFVIDSLHRLTSHTDGAGNTVTYGYDLNDNPTSITYPATVGGGGTVTRVYDDAGRLSSLTDWLSNTTQFGYDPNSNLTRETYPNGAVATIGYDNADELTSIADSSPAAGQFLNLAYTRDPAGLLASEGSSTYTYNPNNEITGQSSGPAISYGYDPAENLATINVTGGPSTTLNYDAAHELTSTATVQGANTTTATFTYNQDGDRTQNSTLPAPYTYDQADQLTGYNGTTYAYNGDGLRTSKTTASATEPYIWDTAPTIPEIIGDGTTAYITGPGGLPLEQITSAGAVHYYHQDQLGSTRAITDSTGAVTNTATYDPYGNPTNQTGALPNPFGYAGQYTDPETGFIYLRNRYYDPQTANFLTPDPYNAETRAPYSYAANSPTNATDPTGLDCATTGQDGGPGSFNIGDWPGWGWLPIGPAIPIGFCEIAGCFHMHPPGDGGGPGGGPTPPPKSTKPAAKGPAQLTGPRGGDLALGLSEYLDPFAARVGATTFRDFDINLKSPDIRDFQAIIRNTVAQGGRIRFNLEGIEDPSGAAAGRGIRGGFTDQELNYVCTNPAIRAATQFYGGPAPC